VKVRLKTRQFIVLIVSLSAISACQRDIPLLGQEDDQVDYDSVNIAAISLLGFDTLDPNGLYWDTSISVINDSNYRYPDIFYNIGDSGDALNYYQKSHFINVSPDTLPLTYQIVPALKLSQFYIPFYLRIFDFELDTPAVDSVLMDSIFFSIGPDTVSTEKYPKQVNSTGPEGTTVTLHLLWK